MPGLSQLKKFSSDLLSVGNEVTARAGRGEKPVIVQIPESIPDINDSEDFVLGMPKIEKPAAENKNADNAADDLQNLTPEPETDSSGPDLSSLLNPINVPDDASAGSDIPDLSMFEDAEPEAEPAPETPAEPEEPSIADMDLNDLLGDFTSDLDSDKKEDEQPVDDLSDLSDLADIDVDSDTNNENSQQNESASDESLDDLDDLEDLEDLDEPEELTDEETENAEPVEEAEPAESADETFDIPEDLTSDLGAETPAENAEDTFDIPEDLTSDSGEEIPAENNDDNLETAGTDSADSPVEDFDIPDDISADINTDIPDAAEPENTESNAESSDLDLDDLGSLDDISDLGETPAADENAENADSASAEEIPEASGADDFSIPDDMSADLNNDSNGSDSLSDMEMPDDILSSLDEGTESEGEKSDANSETPEEPAAADDFGIPEDMSSDFNTDADGEKSETPGDISELDDIGIPDDLETAAPADDAKADEKSDDEGAGVPDGLFDSSDMEMPEELDEIPDAEEVSSENASDFQIPDFDETNTTDNAGNSDVPLETFDISDMEGMDFGLSEGDSGLKTSDSDFQFGKEEDFAMEGDFEIPGFSDVETAKEDKKSKPLVSQGAGKKRRRGKKGLDTPDFSDAVEAEELPPNTLSDEQYKIFQKNLKEYPLNVRLAFEDLIVQDEFTEDAEFEVIEKILAKAPARSVAAMLEKMLDISIPVPRDYEHRSADEYEAYKKSLSYQLKNKIIPGALLAGVALLVGWGLFNFGKNCIYKPLKADSLYKQGYTLLQANEYPQSEMKFNEAVTYKLNKNWFFNYARGYRDHKQYQRSADMYKNILYCFNHDKAAGLEYASMELNDLANYPKAEEIVRREVLDYHVNDADGILLLGDTFLEWGTEKDPAKLEDARAQYATLLSLYGGTDLYLSRMMRYFIRSDNLRQVLSLKSTFVKDRQLSNADWTELSGYLLEKAYGPLSPSEEYLRYQIEGLRGLLTTAVKTGPENPVALYDLGKYYVLTNETNGIRPSLQKSIDCFNEAPSIKSRDLYKYIDAYRLLGEYFTNSTDYLRAQEQFAQAINLYTSERDNAGFKGTPEIGKIYEDLADIKYFVSGDYDDALTNYKYSVDLKNDSPSIRYKIGYIQYKNKDYTDALGSFMKTGDGNIKERNLVFAMANTLAIRGDDYTAQGYYENLIGMLDDEIAEKGLVLPQSNEKDYDVVNTYLQAANNYGVTLYRLAKRTGNSALNSQAIVQFQQSVRAWDALTRNQQTMVRLGGSNLAEENIKYITHKIPDYEPSIYNDIPKTLFDNEKINKK